VWSYHSISLNLLELELEREREERALGTMWTDEVSGFQRGDYFGGKSIQDGGNFELFTIRVQSV